MLKTAIQRESGAKVGHSGEKKNQDNKFSETITITDISATNISSTALLNYN
jgi:hypothetical protein